jgi:hypothetical protein
MKQLFLYTLTLSILALFCSNMSSKKITNKNCSRIKLELNDDFGYLTKRAGLEILDQIKMTRKSDEWWEIIKDFDTIGKYFKSKETGNYILCLLDLQHTFDFETHVLIELKWIEKNTYKVMAKERYFHGNYACCWTNSFSGFNQMSNYFTFDVCGTGSGFCGAKTYYFKNVMPQDSLIGIADQYSSEFDTFLSTLVSTKHIKDNILTYHYRFEHFDINQEEKIRPIGIDTFSIDYILKNNTWFCNDKRIENLQY